MAIWQSEFLIQNKSASNNKNNDNNTSTKIIIRNLAENDFDTFSQYQSQLAQETTHTLKVVNRPPEMKITVDRWMKAKEDSLELILGAFDQDRLIAICALHPYNRNSHPWISHIALFGVGVLKKYWGQGLAQHLMSIIERHAQKSKIKKLEAGVRVQNERGVYFYKKLGFEIEGCRKNAAFIDGKYQDEFYIAKWIGLLDSSIRNFSS